MTGEGNKEIGQKHIVCSLPVPLTYLDDDGGTYNTYGVDCAAANHGWSSRATVVTAGSRTPTYLRSIGCHGRKTHEAPMPASQLASSLSPLGLGIELGIWAFSHGISTKVTGQNSAFRTERWQSEGTTGRSTPSDVVHPHFCSGARWQSLNAWLTTNSADESPSGVI